MKTKIPKSIQWILAIAFIAIMAAIPLSDNLRTSFVHTDNMPERDVFVAIVAGHGSIVDNTYQTPGKQSPEWEDGLKVYEGKSTKRLAYELAMMLDDLDIDHAILNPKPYDLSLQDRAQLCNNLWLMDRRTVCIFLHHNAQPTTSTTCPPDYTDPYGLKGYTSYFTGGAVGNEIYTSRGQTRSDCLADDIAQSLNARLPDMPLRYDLTDGDYDKEANFYVLYNTWCPAILIEFGFMTTYTDCKKIVNPIYRHELIMSIIDGLYLYAPASKNNVHKDSMPAV